ncbi:hypothetical protein [Clostridium sp. Marseille-P299]|uniref:hypothetical protein n=1 Tax=Clostridium sp. Marseille-P299 TaxID=1805477 RepID=UPI00082EA44B|nr:hypothetical protein [Clostridium sp. Marseille-P299]
MKNNRFGLICRLVLGVSVLMAICFLIIHITRQTENTNDKIQPFDISVAEVKVISNQQEVSLENNLKQMNQHEKRLSEKLLEEQKSITVKVYWRGGRQETTIPLVIDENDAKLLK